MIKIIDVDTLFDKYIEKYVYDNIGKVKPEEIENQIPVLYAEFGDKACAELDGKTPNTYYNGFSTAELLNCLKTHLSKDVSVSDFLCEAIVDKQEGQILINELNSDGESEEYVAYIMNFLNDMGATIPVERYLEFATWDYPESIGELSTEFLCKDAERAKNKILEIFPDVHEEKKARLTEILSNTKDDDRVFDILLQEFVKNMDKIPQYAGYLAKFGDDRAIPFLKTAIESDKISYADFEELRFALEALGSIYDKERDFSADKTYKKIKGIKNSQKKS